jgi:aryl-phospho-beta-D-glucosidase BglC (GH1 family)
MGALLLGACGPDLAGTPSSSPQAVDEHQQRVPPTAGSLSTTSTVAPTTTIPPTTLAPATTVPLPTTTQPRLTRLAGEPGVGVNFHGTWSNYSKSVRSLILDDFAAAGVQWVRIDLGWASFEPSGPGQIEPGYAAQADAAINEVRARGMKVLATLWSTPGWANVGHGNSTPPENPADYARIAQWVATRYQGRVAAWEVWNEPNIDDFWVGHDPGAYAGVLRAAYPAIKSGDPNALVVAGATSFNDTAYLTALYDQGIAGSFDVLATHPYQGQSDAAPETVDDGSQYTLAHVQAVHQLMAQRGDGGKPIWFTEFGWSSHDNPAGTPTWQRGVTEAQQGDYLIRTLRWIATNAPYVTNTFWYNDLDTQAGSLQYDNYGLLRTNLSPKPAYSALKAYLTGLTG